MLATRYSLLATQVSGSNAETAVQMVIDLVVAEVLLELAEGGFGVDDDRLDAGDGGEVLKHFGGDRVAVTGVVRAAGVDP